MAVAAAKVNGLNLTPVSEANQNYKRATELKALDDTKSGVKGLVDAGITEIPRIFYQPPEESDSGDVSGGAQIKIPVIALEGVDKDSLKRKYTVNRIRKASEKLGFFQLGIPASVVEEMKDGVGRFHEQETELKKQYYSRDLTKLLIYTRNFDLYSAETTNWRDAFRYVAVPNSHSPRDLPEITSEKAKIS